MCVSKSVEVVCNGFSGAFPPLTRGLRHIYVRRLVVGWPDAHEASGTLVCVFTYTQSLIFLMEKIVLHSLFDVLPPNKLVCIQNS